MSQHTANPGSTSEARSPWLLLLIALASLYMLHACYAVAVQRHLYGDASWFLVRMISEAKPTNMYSSFAHEFYYSRVVAYWLTQLPAVIAVRANVVSVDIISYIFGATYFGHRLISLAVCYLLLSRGEKHLIVFPLLGLFAGSIVSDVYIVTEIHISTSFLWPIAILLFRERLLVGWAYGCSVVSILLAAFTYESWAFFAPLLLAALVFRQATSKEASRFPVAAALALFLCAILNWCAILLPRDPANKDGFVKGTLRIGYDCFAGISHWHIAAMVAALAITCAIFLVAMPSRSESRGAWWFATAMAVIFAVAPPLHFYLTGHATDLSYAVTDRGFAGLVLQAGLLVVFLGVCLFRRQATNRFGYIAIVLTGLSIGQVTWQVMATHSWKGAADAVRLVVSNRSGMVPCNVIDSAEHLTHSPSPSAIMCTWWSTPFSLLQNDHRQVHTLLTTTSSFQAFNVTDPNALPGASDGAFKYEMYLDALKNKTAHVAAGTIRFGEGANGLELLRSGFSHPEESQTWTDGQIAVMHMCLPQGSDPTNYRVTFTMIPHLDPRHLPLRVQVNPGTSAAVDWEFQPSNPPWVTRSIELNRTSFGGSSCGDIRIHFSSIPASPADLGEGNDNRRLGLALIQAKIDPL